MVLLFIFPIIRVTEVLGGTAVDNVSCMKTCKTNTDCAGYALKEERCYVLGVDNQYNLQEEAGTDFFKKVKQEDFAKEALLQATRDINCLQGGNNAESSCAYPYDYKGTVMYACREGCSATYRYKILDCNCQFSLVL